MGRSSPYQLELDALDALVRRATLALHTVVLAARALTTTRAPAKVEEPRACMVLMRG